MTLSEARKILGLGPDEDPAKSLAGFQDSRTRLAEMVRTAPNETLALRYQDELMEFDRALAAVRESMEKTSPAAVPSVIAEPEKKPAKPAPTQKLEEKKSSSAGLVWVLTLILLAVAGGLFYFKYQEDQSFKTEERLADLERQGALLIDNRRWPDATKIYDEIESIFPKSVTVAAARRSIAAGILEEQTQFIGYWTGQARASFEASRWDEAAAAARQVLEKYPDEKEPAEILAQIDAARAAEADRATLNAARDQLNQRKWDEAIATASKLPNDEDAKNLISEATKAKAKATADLAQARGLLQQAKARDQGQFDQQSLDWLREAAALAPDDAEIKAQLEKISSYTRTVRVPGDFATPAEALDAARDRDRIVIAAGTWTGPLVVNVSVDIQGAGSETTLVQCPAAESNTITFGPGASGTRISGISFRHESFDPGEQRFSAGLIRGSTVDLVDCKFSDASGHGLAAIEGGHAIISRCKFTGNGWDGVAASGAGSLLEVRDSESSENFGHGIESWDEAAVILIGNRCKENSGNGIHADNGGASVTIEKNQLIGNREFGLVLGSAGSGKVTGNTATGNLLGGYVLRSTSAPVAVTGNEATKNEGPGLILDIGLLAATYAENTISSNTGEQVLINADLSATAPVVAPPPSPAPAPVDPPRAIPVQE